MENRYKTELRATFGKCGEEAKNITGLLDDLLKRQKELVEKVEVYDCSMIRDNRKKIMALTQLYYAVFNKLLSINMDLESVLDMYETETWQIEISQDMKGDATSLYKSDTMSIIPSCTNQMNQVSINKKLLNPVVPTFYPSSNTFNRLNQNNLYSDNNSCSQKLKDETIFPHPTNNTDQISSVQANQKIINSPEALQSSEEELRAIEEHKSVEEVHEEKLSSVKQLNASDSSDTSSPHTPVKPKKTLSATKSHKYTKQSDRTLGEFRNQYKGKTRFERKFENITTDLPDLSFKGNDSSSDYHSVAETTDKSEVATLKTKNTGHKSPKKEPSKHVQEIPDLDVPKVDDITLVLFIIDPFEFYIAYDNSMLLSISNQLDEYAKGNCPYFRTKNDAKSAIDKYCIAYSTEFKSWNRAEIKQWNPMSDENVHIQYVDFGEYATVKFTDLIPILPSLCLLPKQAIRCSLHNVKPVTTKGWSVESIAHFTKLCYTQETYTNIQIVSVKYDDQILHIDFRKLDEELTCSEQMIIYNHAKILVEPHQRNGADFMVRQVRQSRGLGESETIHPLEALDQFCNAPPTRNATMADAMIGYNAQDDRRLCRFTRADGTCFKGLHCRLEHKFRRKDGITTDTEEVLVAPENCFMPNVNEALTVNITSFKSPSLIYGQLKYEGNNFGGVMREMFKNMNASRMIATYEVFKYQPAVDELVIAKNQDNRWYRGIILEISPSHESHNPLIKIFFVDVGEEVDVLLENVRKMIKGFVIHPYQAFQFRINNIKPVQFYNEDVFESFAANYLFTDVTMVVKHAGSHFIDGVFTDESSCDIGAELIRNNLAEGCEVDYHPHISNKILVD